MKEYVDHLQQVFEMQCTHQLYLNPTKWMFGIHKVEFFSHMMRHEKVKIDLAKVAMIDKWADS